MKKTILSILLIFGLHNQIFSQDEQKAFSGQIGLRGMWQTGNLAQLFINPNAKFFIEKNGWFVELSSNYERLSVEGGTVLVNDFWSFAMVQYNKKNKKVFPMAIAHSGFAVSYAVENSTLGGIGAGAHLIEKDAHRYFQINTFVGMMHLKYDFAEAHQAPTAGTYIKFKFPIQKEQLYLAVDLHTYLSMETPKYRGFNSSTNLTYILNKDFSLELNYRTVYNRDTPDWIHKYNGKLNFGLRYTI